MFFCVYWEGHNNSEPRRDKSAPIHSLPDLVSEFVWVRTRRVKKKDSTLVIDRSYAGHGGEACVVCFDDHLVGPLNVSRKF